MKSFNDLVELSVKPFVKSKGFEIDLKINVNGETWKAYEANIAHREILFFCDKGCATFFVDSYGSRNVAELFDWEESA